MKKGIIFDVDKTLWAAAPEVAAAVLESVSRTPEIAEQLLD